MQQDWIILGFDEILTQLQQQAASEAARARLACLTPAMRADVCRARLAETTDARDLIEESGMPPLAMMPALAELMALCAAEGMLTPAQLGEVSTFARTCGQMVRYLARARAKHPALAAYGGELADLSGLEEEIDACVQGDRLADHASRELRRLRRQMEEDEGRIRTLMDQALKNRRAYLADSYVTIRQGHHVLPVQKRFQQAFGGVVIERSAKGNVVFMEPGSVAALQRELDNCRLQESAEERRLLYALSARVAEAAEDVERNMRLMEELDALFARAKLSLAMAARAPQVTDEGSMHLVGALHPLLPREKAVPLDLAPGGAAGVAITGPNTGGKTVALKTLGLLSLMAQCGLHIPCEEGTCIRLWDEILCDIGDSQSITLNLSTFSGHMAQVKRILAHASRDSLVLLDELGSGTDPKEGMGIAIAVLEELRRRGSFFLTTTHDPGVRAWAEQTPGVLAASMAFDRETLSPLYRLEMGCSGESCAIPIARRLGLPKGLLRQAAAVAAGQPMTAEKPLHVPATRLVRPRTAVSVGPQFATGDSVALLPGGEGGIIYRAADDKGNWLVQVQGEKRLVNHTRLKLRVPAAALYPPDYDFSIIFDTVANRKAAHTMARKYDPEAVVVLSEGAEDT